MVNSRLFFLAYSVLYPQGTSLQTSRLFTAATKAEHLEQQTAKQKKPTKDNKIKQKNPKPLRSVSSPCSCRRGLEKAAGKTRIRIKQGGNTECRT